MYDCLGSLDTHVLATSSGTYQTMPRTLDIFKVRNNLWKITRAGLIFQEQSMDIKYTTPNFNKKLK